MKKAILSTAALPIQMLKFALLLLFFNPVNAQSPTLPTGFAQTILADGLNPTAMVFDHHGNLYLAQKDGRVLLVNEAGQLLPDPVISLSLDDFNERGLAGIALHPDFDQQPWLYLYYTARDSNFNRISRVRINGSLAVPGSEQWLLDCDPLSAGIHNGGAMAFGKDGKLYVGTGDGGNGSNSQSLNNTLGKILRLNDDGSIPSDNPFYNTLSGKARAIFASGLRNPFGMAIQPGTGRIFVSDVGQGAFEEVNEIMPSRNYGWNQIEGPIAAQTPPPSYQDPFFAYAHAEGCAIVGAAFYNPENVSFPANYEDKFFFADYCNGVVRLLDPNTQTATETFATGLKQPVAFAVNPHTGELFYLMRSGIGGGSVVDNTSTNNGTLWRVFYTGSGAPFVSVPPQDVLLPVGENARFEMQVLGTAPFEFQWQRDGADLSGAIGASLEINNVQLNDDGASFRCIVRNAEGRDTSSAALLTVTSTQRPQPAIVSPSLNQTYKAGETIHFQGFATDPENGLLSPDHLRWRIDFHHDTHTHPALASISGISEGDFTIPLAGETSPNTWYRIYLTAIDSGGLEQTVFTEIFPEKTSVTLDGPQGLPVNVDGVIRPLPYTFEGLKGQQRAAQATPQMVLGDTLFIFQKWTEAAGGSSFFNFLMPDTPGVTLHTEYSRFPLGNGSGLYGEYFNDPNFNFEGTPEFVRTDTTVNFNWGDSSPALGEITVDNYTVRWRGFVAPIFTETYTFSVRSDDGSRLWIGDSLLIDQWNPQISTEHSGKISLEAGIQYPLRLEYMEMGGGSDVAFFWSSAHTPKAIVPKRQLYPIAPIQPALLRGKVWLDENANGVADLDESGLQEATILLHQADSTFSAIRISDALGLYQFENVLPGTYFLLVLTNAVPLALEPSFGLNDFGQTQFFEVAENELRTLDLGFKPKSVDSYTPENQVFNLNISPNPSHENLLVEVSGEGLGTTKWALSDLAGRVLSTQLVAPEEQVFQLNVSALLPGIYFLRAENGLGRVVKRFVKY